MKKHNRLFLTLQTAFAGSLLSGCMTVFSGNSKTILINRDTTEPLTIVTASDTTTTSGQLATVSIRKRDLNKPIHLYSEHYAYQPLIPGRKMDGMGTILDLYFCGIGLIVDMANSSIYTPRQTTYYVTSALKDTLRSPLPTADHRAPSPFKPTTYTGQHYRHELRFGGGIGNALHNRCYDRMSQRANDRYGLRCYDGFTYCGLGAVANFSVSLSYFYHPNERWAMGLIAGTGDHPGDDLGYPTRSPGMQNWNDDEPRHAPVEFAGGMWSTSWFFLPAAKCYWAFFSGCKVYSKAAVGLMSQHNWFEPAFDDSDIAAHPVLSGLSGLNERRWHWAGQLSPVGIEMGRSWLRFFAELGYGMEGVLNIGWSCHF